MPTLIAATVIVMISKGIFNKPRRPMTEEATKIFGIRPITITLSDLKISNNIIDMTENTIIKEFICDLNND